MNALTRAYYRLTAYIPRKLPDTEEDFRTLKTVLVEAYGVPDDAPVWVLVSGFITSTPAIQLRRPWGHIANAANRLRINNLAMGFKHEAMQQLNERLADAMKRESERMQNDEKNAALQSEADGQQKPAEGAAGDPRGQTVPTPAPQLGVGDP